MNKDRSYIKCKQIKKALVKNMHVLDLGSAVILVAWTVFLTSLWVLTSKLKTEVLFDTAAKRSVPCPLKIICFQLIFLIVGFILLFVGFHANKSISFLFKKYV